MASALPENTKRAYRAAWKAWVSWAEAHGVQSLPADPKMLALYVTDAAQSGLKVSTLTLRLAAIRAAHLAADLPNPTENPAVRQTMRAVRRTRTTLPEKKAPIRLAELKVIVNALPQSLTGVRDRALLLLGWAGALRRSEVVGVNVEHLRSEPSGDLKLYIPKSKTDQEGAGHLLGIPKAKDPDVCPVTALKVWCEVSGVHTGPLFRPVDRHGNVGEHRLSADAVGDIVKHATGRVDLGRDLFAGHSLRSGFATEAGAQGIEERLIARQTRHTNLEVLRGYIRDGNVLSEQNAARLAFAGAKPQG